jgi:lysophospholipase L1-like esterase
VSRRGIPRGSGGRRRRAGIGLLAACAILVLSLATSSAGARPSSSSRNNSRHIWIVSLGDSYTAGNGAGNYYQPDNGCHRSYDAYPWRYLAELRANGISADLWHAACGSAVIQDITKPYNNEIGAPMEAQLDEVPAKVKSQADIVLLTIGGNDLQFSDVVAFCVTALRYGWASTCSDVLTNDSGLLPLVTKQTEQALARIAAEMPHAQIVLLGYPHLTSPSCPRNPFSDVVDTLQGRFDSAQAQAVEDSNKKLGTTRFHYVPTLAAFNGRGPCASASRQLIHNIITNKAAPRDKPSDKFSWESFHPNKAGHQAIADLLFQTGVQNWVAGQPPVKPPLPSGNPIIIVADNSGSMGDDDGTGRVKIEGEKIALLDFLKTVEPGTPIGLRTYPGGESQGSCTSGIRRFPVAPRDPGEMSALIRSMEPNGDTPTADAMRAAVNDLRAAGYTSGTLVLISDGLSNCGDNPCDVAKEIVQSGFNLETITVGFQISKEGQQELKCIAGAMGGQYVDVTNSAGLAQAFGQISRPALQIDLDHPSSVVAEVGNDPSGLVRLKATISNTSQQEARDVVVWLRFDSQAPGVNQPLYALGNIAPSETRSVSWSFWPGLTLAGTTVGFTIVARADNSLSDSEAKGAVAILDQSDPRFAGPILRDRKQIAILGDSYSSGEGTGDYIFGTDTQRNSCHRSLFTYLMQAFGQPASSVVACSGAVAWDIFAPQNGDDVASQQQQLADLANNRGVDAVVLTLGGNDAGFGKVALSCLAGPSDCSRWIYPNLPWPTGRIAADDFVEQRLAGLDRTLATAYSGVNKVLNSKKAVERRGSVAPIFAPAYPLPVPLGGRACLTMLDQLSPAELAFIGRYASELNAKVEEATREARQELDVPVFFVPNTENAFLPDHTVCDGTPYARAIDSFGLAGADVKGFLASLLHKPPWTVVGSGFWSLFSRSKNQLLHPNKLGYAAMTNAIIRWSLSGEARADAELLRKFEPAGQEQPASFTSSDLEISGDLGQDSATAIQGGSSYPLNVGGFAPGSSVEIVVNSQRRLLAELTADAKGRIQTRIAIPTDLGPGGHTLEIAGIDPARKKRVIRIPIERHETGRPLLVNVIGASAFSGWLLAVVGWLSIAIGWRWRRHDALRVSERFDVLGNPEEDDDYLENDARIDEPEEEDQGPNDEEQ